ncbi:MAG TPA: aminotransferase class I/II-fold pyridoxal phosphate-dependent enzyme [Burkholderiales bacterium]|jgi:aspartate/methionine/tyrosine aminotransferase|nr:aminotransferase class I/II-fold pyridoxal phosphate-dependent enzyme [Burkholderiales bacterium]
MRTAKRAEEIQPFEVMDVLSRAHALERAGRHVVHMEIGEPDFSAPEPVVEAGVRALRDGRTAYTATLGLPELRDAIAGHYEQKFKTKVDASRAVVTSGASGGLLTVAALYVEPGDEILVPDPGYPGYRHFVRAFEGRARALNVGSAENFQPTLAMVRDAWGPKTKGLLLGSPSNPTGTLISKTELAAIAAFIAERGGVLMVDEIYQGLTYGTEPSTALGLPGDVVIINSFSKYFCMTGWRLGWVVLPPSAVRGFEKLAQHLFISAPSAAQHAACAAFAPESIATLEQRRGEFARRRDFLLPVLRKAGLSVPAEPRGAFYIYADCGRDARRFCMDLLEKEAVAATPGVDFGANGTERFVRFAYTRAMGDLEEAARRITRFAGPS